MFTIRSESPPPPDAAPEIASPPRPPPPPRSSSSPTIVVIITSITQFRCPPGRGRSCGLAVARTRFVGLQTTSRRYDTARMPSQLSTQMPCGLSKRIHQHRCCMRWDSVPNPQIPPNIDDPQLFLDLLPTSSTAQSSQGAVLWNDFHPRRLIERNGTHPHGHIRMVTWLRNEPRVM